MGYGDDVPPSIRADPKAATLTHPNRFEMLFLTFVDWDIIKLRWSLEGGEPGYTEIPGGHHGSTDYVFEPALSDGKYTFTAQGCSKAADGSTGYCSPVSGAYYAIAARNTNSLTQFLQTSGIDLSGDTHLRTILKSGDEIHLRALMGIP